MPLAAAFIDALRQEFGRAGIDANLAAGMRGEPNRFHAIEGQAEIGTPFTGQLIDPPPLWVPRA